MRSEVILVSYDTRMYRIGTANKSDKMRLRLVQFSQLNITYIYAQCWNCDFFSLLVT